MRIIDRYLLWFYIKAFIICFLSFAGLYIVIDCFGNLTEFISHGHSDKGLLVVIGTYYLARMFAFFNVTSAIVALIAAMFTISWLQRDNEMIALMTAGVSKRRVAAPLIAMAGVICLLSVANRELLIPALRETLSFNTRNLDTNTEKTLKPRYDNQTNIMFRSGHTIATEQRISEPTFRLPASLHQFGKQLSAKNALYRSPRADQPGGYHIQGVHQPVNIAGIPSAYDGEHAVILTPHDTAWLAQDECFIASNVEFHQLEADVTWRSHSATGELIASLRNPSLSFGADLRVTIHSRLVRPLLDMTLLMLGLPLVLSRKSRNIFVAIGLGVFLVNLFMVVVIASHSLGNHYVISPALAAWLPLIIFVPVAVSVSEPLTE